MLKHMVQWRLLPVLVKNVLGIRVRRGRKPPKGFPVLFTHLNKKSKIPVIDFDPRPKSCRKVTSDHINNFEGSTNNIKRSRNFNVGSPVENHLHWLPAWKCIFLQDKIMALIKNMTPQSVSVWEPVHRSMTHPTWEPVHCSMMRHPTWEPVHHSMMSQVPTHTLKMI